MKNTNKLIAIAALAAASFAGSASAATHSQEEWFGAEPVAQGPALSRAEVQADLNLWNRAGLSDYNSGETTHVADAAYDQKVAEYRRLRSGAEYTAEVRRLGGDVSAVAGRAATGNAH